jgi:hypothetical protein
MTQSYERFFIPLPGSRKTAPRTRHREIPQEANDDGWEDHPPYLRGLPSLPDFLAHLAANRGQTKAEIDCLTRYVRKLARRIKKARTKWETAKSDVVDSL